MILTCLVLRFLLVWCFDFDLSGAMLYFVCCYDFSCLELCVYLSGAMILTCLELCALLVWCFDFCLSVALILTCLVL